MKKDLSGSYSSCYVRGTLKCLVFNIKSLIIYRVNTFFDFVVIMLDERRWSSQGIYLVICWLYLDIPTAVYVTFKHAINLAEAESL